MLESLIRDRFALIAAQIMEMGRFDVVTSEKNITAQGLRV
jgi:hypothetical protein